MQTAVLSLGTRKDASTWINGCRGLSITNVDTSLLHPQPKLAELKTFFESSQDWFYFGGHFSAGQSYNDAGNVKIDWHADHVAVQAHGQSANLRKGSELWSRNQRQVRVVLWGGCMVLNSHATITTLQTLFGDHLILGFTHITGWRIVDAMLGGGFIPHRRSFFGRVSAESTPTEMRNAWLQTALYGYRGNSLATRFAAVDPDGTRWIIRNGQAIRG